MEFVGREKELQKADKLRSKLLRYKKEFRALSIDDM